MADRVECSCVTCPNCGSWVVVREYSEVGENKEKFRARCPAPDCEKQFEFDSGETQVFELSLALLERRYFYRSELP
jgi:hypothetical protein